MTFDLKEVKSRPYQGEEDLPALVNLINLVARTDGDTLLQTPESVQRFIKRSNVEIPQLWETESGQLLMNVSLVLFFVEERETKSLEVRAVANVHPEVRGQGLEDLLLAWSLDRANQLGTFHRLSTNLTFRISDTVLYWREALERTGFKIARYFLTMENRPTSPLIEPSFPSGFSVRDRAGLIDPRAWADLYNQSFIDHYNPHEISAAEVEYANKNPDYRPDLDLVVVAPNGEWAALCLAEMKPGEKIEGEQVGRIGLLGTRRGYRNRGIGRAALLTGMHHLQKEGSQRIRLLVDASSLTGATRLYEAVGFSICETYHQYSRDVITALAVHFQPGAGVVLPQRESGDP